MSRRRASRVWIAVALVLVAAAAPALMAGTGSDPIVVLAPSSLAPSEDRFDDAFEAAGLGPVTWVFAGSQSLVAQLADGAPADVVITADRTSFDAAREAGATWPIEHALTTNRLVLAVSEGNPGGVTAVEDLGNDALLVGLCAPDVPCGRLSTEALTASGVTARPDTEETSARALTTKLVAGELDVGLIYSTDARATGLETVFVPGLDDAVNTYWGTAAAGGAAVLDFLASDAGRALFALEGFGR